MVCKITIASYGYFTTTYTKEASKQKSFCNNNFYNSVLFYNNNNSLVYIRRHSSIRMRTARFYFRL